MTDILAHWKIKKFVVTENCLKPCDDQNQILIVLTDFNFWVTNHNDLRKWCEENNGKVEGMTVLLPDQRTLTAFMLKWS
jgi:hypothetical protein